MNLQNTVRAFAVLLVLATSQVAPSQVIPSVSFVEIDADYGDGFQLSPGDGGSYQDTVRVVTGGQSTLGRKQAGCTNWSFDPVVEGGAPYMGHDSFRMTCPDPGTQRRTEQMVFSNWFADDPDRRTRYFSLAFRLTTLEVTSNREGFIAQWHQSGRDNASIPLILKWTKHVNEPLLLHLYANGQASPAFEQVLTPIFPEPKVIYEDVWYRILIQVTLASNIHTNRCPIDTVSNRGHVTAWIMNNHGVYVGEGSADAAIGDTFYTEQGEFGPVTLLLPEEECSLQWKVGIYRNNITTGPIGFLVMHLDNIAYGKRWNDITKNRLIGQKKSVLSLRLSGNTNDYSWLLNGAPTSGDPVTDYNNDATLMNSRGASWGTGFLRLLTNGWVRYPARNSAWTANDLDEFDFGNHVTMSVWLRTSFLGSGGDSGIVMITRNTGSPKLFLRTTDTGDEHKLTFGVKHHDGTTSQVSQSITSNSTDIYPYLGTGSPQPTWHHVVGVFNRFAPDGQRVKLYVDYNMTDSNDTDEGPFTSPGSDKPMMRPEASDFLVVGAITSTSGFFKGDIEDVSIFNYSMTDAEVQLRTQQTQPSQRGPSGSRRTTIPLTSRIPQSRRRVGAT